MMEEILQEAEFSFSEEEVLFLEKLNLPVELLEHSYFSGKIVIIPKTPLNMMFLNETNPIYSVNMHDEEKHLSEEIWYSNIISDVTQIIIVNTPLDALYYERLYPSSCRSYLAVNEMLDNKLNALNLLIKKSFINPNLYYKICYPNELSSFFKELRLVTALTGENFFYSSEDSTLTFTSSEEKKLNEVYLFFLRIKENINLENVKKYYYSNDIITVSKEKTTTKIRFINNNQLKEISRKLIISLSKTLSFLENIDIERPPITNKKELYDLKLINHLKFPR